MADIRYYDVILKPIVALTEDSKDIEIFEGL